MDDLIAARLQMAISLAFHIVFAVVGIAMPLFMVIAEWRWLRTKDEAYLALAKRWAKGTAVLFAVGAVSGTVLSFELGLLWPRFMGFAGSIVGLPFALEGFAFFSEAIFLGIYLYGWDRVSPRAHLLAGAVVAASGALSAVFVVIANAWMNTPTGFRMEGGRAVDIDPIAAVLNPSAFPEVLHMLVAAYAATGLAVAGIHALVLLRAGEAASGPAFELHRRALAIALAVGGAASVAQPLTGHVIAAALVEHQPIKFAAAEAHFRTGRAVPIHLGGVPDVETGEVPYAIVIPRGLSILAHEDPNAEVTGLDKFPRDLWPNVLVVHTAFDVMVGAGVAMIAVSLMGALLVLRGRPLARARLYLKALVLAAPLGILATEAGWVVTEVGRQPWIVYNVMRTSEAVTPMRGLWVPLGAFSLVYAFLAVVVVGLIRRGVRESMAGGADASA